MPALAAHYLTFILGLLFMLCYYLWFHPTGVQIIIRFVMGRLAIIDFIHLLPFRQDSVRAVPSEAPMTELVQLSKEPERGGKELSNENAEQDIDSAGGEVKKQKLLPQMEKLALSRSLSAPHGPPLRGQTASQQRVASAPHASSSDLSAARKLKYMGQKPSDVV